MTVMPLRKAVADIGEAAIDHDLHAVAAAALVAVAEEFDVVRRDGVHDYAPYASLS